MTHTALATGRTEPMPYETAASRPRGPSAAAGGYLAFTLGTEAYCIDILKVQEIRSFSPPTHMAGTQAHICGVIDLRGVIVPIVDLRIKLGLSEAPRDANTVVIVLNLEHGAVGVVADAVREVVELALDDIRVAPSFNAQVDADFVLGLAHLAGSERHELLIVADIERLLAADVFGAGSPTGALATEHA
jgi:purine-binding chemotaxis protein CheW